jgi:hypothetical protein
VDSPRPSLPSPAMKSFASLAMAASKGLDSGAQRGSEQRLCPVNSEKKGQHRWQIFPVKPSQTKALYSISVKDNGEQCAQASGQLGGSTSGIDPISGISSLTHNVSSFQHRSSKIYQLYTIPYTSEADTHTPIQLTHLSTTQPCATTSVRLRSATPRK